MVLTRISLVIPLGMINVMQGTAQRLALVAGGRDKGCRRNGKNPKPRKKLKKRVVYPPVHCTPCWRRHGTPTILLENEYQIHLNPNDEKR